MNFSYLFAVVANRAVGLIYLLALSYLVSIAEFGNYSLIATNALLAETIFGVWLVTAATRQLALRTGEVHTEDLAFITKIAGWIILAELLLLFLAIGFAYVTTNSDIIPILIFVGLWSIGNLLFDIVLAAQNALGHSSGYLSISLSRIIIGAILSLMLVQFGFGAFGAATGQILGIVIATGTSKAFWTLWRPVIGLLGSTKVSLSAVKDMLQFGFVGALVLGIYILIQGIIRNGILLTLDKSAFGIFALVSDLSFAPITLITTAYSLSKMRKLYQLQRSSSEEVVTEHSLYIATNFFLILPFGAAGFILAPDAVAMFLSEKVVERAVPVASYLVLHSSLLGLLFSHMTLLLTIGQKRKVVLGTFITLVTYALTSVAGYHFGNLVAIAQFSIIAAIISVLITGRLLIPGSIPLKSLIRSTLGAIIMVVTILLANNHLHFLLTSLIAILIYLFSAFVLKPIPFREFLQNTNPTIYR